jgi:hypothetical protein
MSHPQQPVPEKRRAGSARLADNGSIASGADAGLFQSPCRSGVLNPVLPEPRGGSPALCGCERIPYHAECLTESIFTEADTWDGLRKNVLEATSAFFFGLSAGICKTRWFQSSSQ